MAIYTLTGTDKEIRVQGRYASVKNNGTETVYASSTPDLEPNAAEVVPIQAGESVIVRDCRKRLYVRGSGQIAVVSGNEPVNFFKPAPKGDGGGGDGITQQQLNDTLESYATNMSVDDKLEDYAKKDEIPTSLPADGGNADTVGGKSAEKLIQSNPNLLLNPDFKVNQRGQTTYSTPPDYTGIKYHTVDRWLMQFHGTVSIDSTGITITRGQIQDTDGNIFGTLLDAENFDENYLNKSMALSMYVEQMSEGSHFNMYIDGKWAPLKLGFNYVTVDSKTTNKWIGVGSFKEQPEGAFIKLKWIKLELGSIATPFVPPNPVEEVLKCGSIENSKQQVLYGNGVWGDIPSNPNLLDNPDFKINQRGEDIYSARGYCVDRWVLYSIMSNNSVGTVTPIASGGINVISGGNRNDSYIIQYIENTERLKGKTVTLSAKIEVVKGAVNIGQYGNDDLATKKYNITQNGVHSITFIWQDSTLQPRNGILVWNNTPECEFNVEWVKFELGSVATPFVPPNPATELTKCQRYLVKFTSDIARNITANSYAFYFSIPLQTPLRISPTISSPNDLLIKKYGTGETHTGFAYTALAKSSPPSVAITATKNGHGIETAVGGILMVSSGKSVLLSADL